MKSVLIGRTKKEILVPAYPRLKIFNRLGLIVLFTSSRTGTLVHDATGMWGVGHTSASWDENKYEDLRGKVILDNFAGKPSGE